jgi:hypothetical protein
VDDAIANLVHCKVIIGRMVTHEMNNLLGTFMMHSLWLVEGSSRKASRPPCAGTGTRTHPSRTAIP